MRAEAWNCIAAAAMPDARPHCAKAWLKQHSTVSSQHFSPDPTAALTFAELFMGGTKHPSSKSTQQSALSPFLATVERQTRLPLNCPRTKLRLEPPHKSSHQEEEKCHASFAFTSWVDRRF